MRPRLWICIYCALASKPALAEPAQSEFTMQYMGPLIYALSAAVLLLVVIGFAYLIYWLASLPGRIATERGHPQASAIGVCGWMGVITLVFWPVAMVWAYSTTEVQRQNSSAVTAEELTRLRASLTEIAKQVAAVDKALSSEGARL